MYREEHLQELEIRRAPIISRQSADADNRPIICFSKQNNKKCF